MSIVRMGQDDIPYIIGTVPGIVKMFWQDKRPDYVRIIGLIVVSECWPAAAASDKVSGRVDRRR